MNRYIPHTFTAGITTRFLVEHADYRDARWHLTLHLRGPESRDLMAIFDGEAHRFAVAFSSTAQWQAGEYAYTLRATDGEDTREIETGRLRVLPDLASLPPGSDTRSEVRIALDAIEAVLGRRATLDQERYRINNRELYRTSISDLLRLRAFYVELLAREEAAAAGRPLFGRQVKFVMRGGG